MRGSVTSVSATRKRGQVEGGCEFSGWRHIAISDIVQCSRRDV